MNTQRQIDLTTGQAIWNEYNQYKYLAKYIYVDRIYPCLIIALDDEHVMLRSTTQDAIEEFCKLENGAYRWFEHCDDNRIDMYVDFKTYGGRC